MADLAPPHVKIRATWLVWAGGGVVVLALLLAAAWWLLPRYAPGLAAAIGTAIPPLTRPLADRCYGIGMDAYRQSFGADPARRVALLHRAGAHLQVARACYQDLHQCHPGDDTIAKRMFETGLTHASTVIQMP